MNLKRYNKETLPTRLAGGTPNLRVNVSGGIVLNKALSEQLKLTENSKIELVQDTDKPKDWFLTVNDTEPALSIRVNKGQAGFMVQNSALAQLFVNAIDPVQKIICVNIAPEAIEHEGEQLWPVITSSYKQYLKKA